MEDGPRFFLADWKDAEGRTKPLDVETPDAYGTGLQALVVAREMRSASDARLQKGVAG